MDLTDLLRRLIGVLEDLGMTYMLVGFYVALFLGGGGRAQRI